MSAWKRHARLLYLFALAQMLVGPLVLALLLTCLPQPVETAADVGWKKPSAEQKAVSAGTHAWNGWSDAVDGPAKPAVPAPPKVKVDKDQTWIANESRRLRLIPPTAQLQRWQGWRAIRIIHRAYDPPVPPPRWG